MTSTIKKSTVKKGKADHTTKIFMEQPDIFADAVNYAVFNGKKVVSPDTLEAAPTVATSFAYNGEEAKISFEKIRDVRKTVKLDRNSKTAYMVYGIENQTELHYAMPVKTMIYDAMEYACQIETRGKTFRKNKDGIYDKLPENEEKPDNAEFLSSWKKNDKLIPVITIAINFSSKKWDAPTSLYDMFEFDSPERNEAIERMIPDYRIKVIDPHQMNDSDYEKLSTEFGTVMKFISNARDKEKLKAMDEEKTLSRNSVEVINSCTGANIPVPEKDKVIKVSEGILGLLEEGRAEGRIEGRAEGKAEERSEMIDALKANGASDELIQAALRTIEEKNKKLQ